NRLQPDEFTNVCNPPIANKSDDTHVTEPNDTEDDITAFARFMRATKVPPRVIPASDGAAVERGADVFRRIGCAVCHVESFQTAAPGTRLIDAGNDSLVVTEALGSKTIHPFSDFLLHDWHRRRDRLSTGGTFWTSRSTQASQRRGRGPSRTSECACSR